jgi:hypothetical protein
MKRKKLNTHLFSDGELDPELPPTVGDELSKEGGGVPYTMSDL